MSAPVAVGAGARVEQIAPRTWRIGSLFGGRDLFQYAIAGEQRTLLVDAGAAATPREAILPALRALAIDPASVSHVVVTHPDLDHQGGAAALLERLPRALVACGFEDRALVSDPDLLLRDRYGAYAADHGLVYPPEAIAGMREQAGAPAVVGLGLVGGERIELGGRTLHVLHAPGHSAGHLVLHEPASGLLFSSDAVHGAMCPDAHGHPALPPTYEQVDAYLATIALLERLAPGELHSGHWPARAGADVAAFLAESRAFVEHADAALLALLEAPCTLRAACDALDARLGPFGADPVNLMFAVHGHLRRLLRTGRATVVDSDERPLRFARTCRSSHDA